MTNETMRQLHCSKTRSRYYRIMVVLLQLVLLMTCAATVNGNRTNSTCDASDPTCVDYSWRTTPDSKCRGECPTGVMYLQVECVSSHNFSVPDAVADRLCGIPRPDMMIECKPWFCGVPVPNNTDETVDYMQTPEVRRTMYIWAATALALTTAFFAYILKGVPQAPADVLYRRRLTFYLNTSPRGTFLEALNALFSIVSCCLFVYETYQGDVVETNVNSLYIYLAELTFSFTFIYSYILWFYAAERKLKYFFSLLPMVDLVTVPPVLLVLFLSDFVFGQGVGFLRFSRIMKFARVLRLLRILKSVHAARSVTQDAIRSQFVTFVSFCLSLVICTTGFVHYVGNEVEDYPGAWGDHRGPMNFHDALYFTVVSFSLVGYGDVAPRGAVGRLVILVLIAASFLVIPMEMNKLLRLYKMKSQYMGVMELSNRESHILVCCDPSCDGLSDFLKEFFHEDHGSQHTKVCVLCPQEPNISMQELILKYKRVIYLKGDAMLPADLVRASCQVADAVFLLTNRHANKPEEQDSVTVLRALNVKAFNNTSRVYVQILKTESKPHILAAGIPHEHILCIEETKLNLLGQAVRFPGTCVLVTNLVTSHSYKAVSDAEKNQSHYQSNPKRDRSANQYRSKNWTDEYFHSLGQEIYCMFVIQGGFTYIDACLQSFKRHNVLIFGVMEKNGYPMLRPFQRTLEVGDMVFVLAENEALVEQVELLDEFGDLKPMFQSADRSNTINVHHGKVVANDSTILIRPQPSGSSRRLSSLFSSTINRVKVTPGIEQNLSSVSQYSNKDLPDQPEIPLSLCLEKASYGMVLGKTLVKDLNSWKSKVYSGLDEGDARRMAGRERILSVLQLSSDYGRTKKWSLLGGRRKKQLQLKPQDLIPTTCRVVKELANHKVNIGAHVATLNSENGDVVQSRVRGRRAQRRRKGETVTKGESTDEVGDSTVIKLSQSVSSASKDVADIEASSEQELVVPLVKVTESSPITQIETSQVSHSSLTEIVASAEDSHNANTQDIGSPTDCKLSKQSKRVQRRRSLRELKIGIEEILKAPTVDMSTRESLHRLVRNHIVVTCHRMRDLELLVARIRFNQNQRNSHSGSEEEVENLQAVVILSPVQPDESVWRSVSRFGNVHFVLGSPHHWPDLLRASVDTAECCLVLGDPANGDSRQLAAGDANVVLTCLIIDSRIDSCETNVRVVAELNAGDYISHLGVTTLWYAGNLSRKGNPLFRRMTLRQLSKRAFQEGTARQSKSMRKVKLSQKSVLNLVAKSTKHIKLEVSKTISTHVSEAPSIFSDFTSASGNVLCETFMGSMLCQAFFNPYVISIVNALIGTEDFIKHVDGDGPGANSGQLPSLHQMHIPKEFIGVTYGELFEHCLFEFGVLPFALYRTEKEHTGLFVFTNPPASCEILNHDRLFVISI